MRRDGPARGMQVGIALSLTFAQFLSVSTSPARAQAAFDDGGPSSAQAASPAGSPSSDGAPAGADAPGPYAPDAVPAPGTYWHPEAHYGHGERPGSIEYSPAYQMSVPGMSYAYRGYNGLYPRTVPATEGGWAPPGLVLPLVLTTAISSRSTKSGDHIEASVTRNVALQGNAYIPAGSTVKGHVTESKGAGFLEHEGSLGVEFTQLSLPDGRTFPISAHLLGGMGTVGSGDIPYSDVHGGQGWMSRMEQMGVTGSLGGIVEGGAGLGSFVEGGAGYNLFRGGNPAYGLSGLASGTTVMGLFNLAGGLLRRGHNVIVPSGSPFQIRLDSAISIDNQPPARQAASTY